MTSIVYKLLGIPADGVTRVADGSIAFRGASHLGMFFVAFLLLTALAIWSYWKTARDVPPVRRYAMAALRATLLALMLVLLLQPVFRYTVEGTVRRSLLMLIDASASMKIADPRTDEADLKRVAIVKNLIDPVKGLDQSVSNREALNGVTRLDVVRAGLTNERLDLIKRLSKDYDLRPMTFGDVLADAGNAKSQANDAAYPNGTNPTAWVSTLKAEAPSTALGDGLRDAILRSRGQPLTGMLVITDGQSNTGSQVTAAAEIARQEKAPLYVWGVGISSPKDVVVASMFAQDVAFLKDQVPVVVRVKGSGMQGRQGKLKLSLSGNPVDAKDVTFTGDEQVVSLEFTPDKPGDYDLVATIDPLNDEAVKDNNTVSQKVKVIDRKIKVLLVETTPRWEYKYLQTVLMRDRRVDAKFVLLESDVAVSQGRDSPYVASFPRDKKDLFAYDLVILGDVDPKGFATQQIDALVEFVDKFGGGLLVISGRRFNPAAYKGTPIAKMLPVELDDRNGASTGSGRDDATAPIKVDLTPAGQSSLFMRITDRQQDNAATWGKLSPIYWVAPVGGAKPGAEVLAVDPGSGKVPGRANQQKTPIFALQQYGLGQVFYSGTDNTWRWRKNDGDQSHITFWGQVIQRLALPHLLGESKRTQLTLDRANYFAGERVTVYARLYDIAFKPIEATEVKGTYASADGRVTGNVMLRPLPDQNGMFRGEFVAPPQGQYQFWVDRDEKTKLALNVGESRIELAETAMNEPLLTEIAKSTGGAFFREEDLYKLPDTVRQNAEGVKSRQEVELWSSPGYFLLLLGVVTAEWVMRKLMSLK
jgi:hypothetical protein